MLCLHFRNNDTTADRFAPQAPVCIWSASDSTLSVFNATSLVSNAASRASWTRSVFGGLDFADLEGDPDQWIFLAATNRANTYRMSGLWSKGRSAVSWISKPASEIDRSRSGTE